MKTIEQLGLSPLPWTLGSLTIGSDGLRARSSIDAADETCVAGDSLLKEEDARLMTASPTIYDKACLSSLIRTDARCTWFYGEKE